MSVFATLECELLDRIPFQNQAEARMAVFDFIEDWLQSTAAALSPRDKSPLNYEKAALEAA